MTIDSVSSSSSTLSPSLRPQQQADQAKQAELAKQAERSKQAEEKSATSQVAQEPKPKPVVNTQGQTTGSVVNTTA